MATSQQPTYTFIPPPPLPEFYLPKSKCGKPKSTSSSAPGEDNAETVVVKEPVAPGDGAYDGTRTFRTNSHPALPLMAIPPPPPSANANAPPPLAIYHVCRVCHRPRSSRYHREHPIPANGLPPPPGICRRCRITSVEETNKKSYEVVTRVQSNKVKLGFITPFIPDEDIVSNEEMKRMRLEKYLKETAKDTTKERQKLRRGSHSGQDIYYRHVRIVDEPADVATKRTRKVTFISGEGSESCSDEHGPEPAPTPKISFSGTTIKPIAKSPSAPAQTVRSANNQKSDVEKASVSTESASSASSFNPKTARPASIKTPPPPPPPPSKPERTDSEIRGMAREEIERYAGEVLLPQFKESYVRKVAHEEIERYRAAERKLESHPDPYARGRMIPVYRRIEVERDHPVDLPWVESSKRGTQSIHSAKRSEPLARKQLPDVDERSRGSNGHEHNGKESWGPRWQRELAAKEQNSQTKPQAHDPSRSATAGNTTTKRQKGSSPDSNPSSDPKRREEQIMERDYQFDESRFRTIKTHSSQMREEWRDDDDAQQGSKTSAARSERFSRAPAIDSNAGTGSGKASDRTYWQEATQQPPKMRQQSLPHPVHEVAHDDDGNPTSMPREIASEETQSRNSVPSERDDGVEWIHIERTVQPAAEPSNERRSGRNGRSERDMNTEWIYTERTVQPADRPVGRQPFDDHAPEKEIVVEEFFESQKCPQEHPQSTRRRRERREADLEYHDKSSRVHFSKKVNISPTPPDSDASSSAFRSFHSVGHGDGHGKSAQGERETDEDLIREFERRGRSRSRHPTPRYAYYDEDRAIREREQELGLSGMSRGGVERGFDGSGDRPLHHALSESPSREQAMFDIKHGPADGRGPYRADRKVTDSMRARYGSPLDVAPPARPKRSDTRRQQGTSRW